jgi:hypothetical protein
VINNIFRNNSAWGLLVIPFPDSNDPEMGQSCSGTGGVVTPGFGCVYDPMNNVISGNTFENNGSFGNPTNGAIGQLALNSNKPSNCFTNNHATGLAGALKALEAAYPVCGVNRAASDAPGDLLAQVDSAVRLANRALIFKIVGDPVIFDKSIKAIEKIMEEKGILDPLDAAAIFERDHPPQAPVAQSGSGGWNFGELPSSTEDADDKYVDSLLKAGKNGISDGALSQRISQTIGEVRHAGRR